MKRLTTCIIAAMAWLPALPGGAGAAALRPEQIEFFEQRIRPILINECYECHGAAKQKGGLRVDYRDGLHKGGDSGPALVPGQAAKSLLIQSIRHENDSAMPKDRPKLSDAVVADFVKWVTDGAPDPRDQPARETGVTNNAWAVTFAARKDWWSFKPLTSPAPPAVKGTNWSTLTVDLFLLARMEERGLSPAAPADLRMVIRRLTFALTGLPPTPEEVDAFVRDQSPDAYAKVVDRLLASPRFGEHWARHWMDLMRFAETHGSEGDPEIPNAWRYRDYLIRAFNTDVPWNQLIREHLAGDMINNPRWNREEGINESLLGLAHFRLVEHGFNPIDTLDEQVKTVDSQIDVVSKAFQGLTTSCARCHDHKFDPISQRDYYALHGIFASTRPTHVTIDAPEKLRVHRDQLESLQRTIRHDLAGAWEQSMRELPATLLAHAGGATNRPAIPGDEIQSRILEAERRIRALDDNGRAAALRQRGATNGVSSLAQPVAAWTFDDGPRDALGGLHGELLGGAVIRQGRLVLNGTGAFLRTAPLEHTLREKTLEAWVAPSTLDQGGGGVLTVESQNGVVFDSIVFAEKEPRKWMAGSDGFRRGRNVKGPVEATGATDLVHMVVTFRLDHRIAIYRNGQPYGEAYTPSGDGATLQTFNAQAARVLLGMRHTGGGTPFFAGEIEEARLYDRALTPAEVKTSFVGGPGLISPADIARALTPGQRAERERLTSGIAANRARLKQEFPDYAARDATRTRRTASLEAAATNVSHPLNVWFALRGKSGEAFTSGWRTLADKHAADTAARAKFNRENFLPAWDLAGAGAREWFRHGINAPDIMDRPGGFSVEPEGDRIVTGLWPAGIFSHRLSQKHNGVLTSPRFKITTDNISVRVIGGKGARVRVIPDNYPIGQGNIYPQAALKSDAPTWVRLDTAYRKGTMAYLELATAGEVTSRDRATAGPGDRSYFGVERIVFHDTKPTPRDELTPLELLMTSPAPASPQELVERLATLLTGAVAAWQGQTLSEPQRLFLDSFLRAGLLPTRLDEIPAVGAHVTEYRRLENEIPAARRAPGVFEAVAYNAPLLSRGDHLKPLDPVPRSYLELVSSRPYQTSRSGRLELAEEIISPTNPLTARVLVNRIWHHLFGRGLVGTVDNFGRLGDKPTHPELLDFLAARFMQEGWSAKQLIRELVTTRAYQMSSDVSPRAREVDPDNQLLSHARTRRLPAESIRDSLLAVSGRLDTTMAGPGDNALAAPSQQRRRSVYLTVRRNFLSPFLETFDAPRPFTTLGRRETTNVPAQSLALLNDPFVIEMAGAWAESLLRTETAPETRVRKMFETALARPPSTEELAGSRAYLDELASEHGAGREQLIWRDYAQALFNLKEFIYVR